jgi:hypothetical protein
VIRKLRFRKDDPEHNLLAATQHWILAHSGSVVVIGGIEVQTWPGDNPHNFRIGIRCTGTVPTKDSNGK